VDRGRLTRPVANELDFRLPDQDWLAVPRLERGLDAAADHPLWRDTVEFIRQWLHEFDIATGDDIGLEAIRVQVLEDLQHRLVDQVREGSLPSRVLRRFQPLLDVGLEFLGGPAGVAVHYQLDGGMFDAAQCGVEVPFQDALEWLFALPIWVLVALGPDPVDRKHGLKNDWNSSHRWLIGWKGFASSSPQPDRC
jgi:hypothetical protein